MARTNVTDEMIRQINDLYLELGTYAGVSRALGGTPSATTIKKYIIPNYIPIGKIQKTTFRKEDLPEHLPVEPFLNIQDFGALCVLSNEEKLQIRELWNEISM